MGNPHAVAFVDDLADAGDLLLPAAVAAAATRRRQRRVRGRPRPPARRDAGARARRGETRSCGTGACAVVVATARARRCRPWRDLHRRRAGRTAVGDRAGRRRHRADRPGRAGRDGSGRPVTDPGAAPTAARLEALRRESNLVLAEASQGQQWPPRTCSRRPRSHCTRVTATRRARWCVGRRPGPRRPRGRRRLLVERAHDALHLVTDVLDDSDDEWAWLDAATTVLPPCRRPAGWS